MRTLTAVILSCMAAAGVAAEPQAITRKVVAVADGDTLTLLDAANVQHKVRLHGIDAPGFVSRHRPCSAFTSEP